MANLIQINPETTVTWRDSGGDEAITLVSLASGAGRNGAIRDWGAAPRASRYHLKMFWQVAVATNLNTPIMVYLREAGFAASIAKPTNDDGTGDVALSAEAKLRNLTLLIPTTIDQDDDTSAVFSFEMIFETPARHFGPVVFNNQFSAFSSTAANNGIDITPIPDEIQ